MALIHFRATLTVLTIFPWTSSRQEIWALVPIVSWAGRDFRARQSLLSTVTRMLSGVEGSKFHPLKFLHHLIIVTLGKHVSTSEPFRQEEGVKGKLWVWLGHVARNPGWIQWKLWNLKNSQRSAESRSSVSSRPPTILLAGGPGCIRQHFALDAKVYGLNVIWRVIVKGVSDGSDQFEQGA